MVQILAGLFIAVFIQLAATCCAPVKMQGFQGVSSGLMVNGIGISAQGNNFVSIDGERNMISITGNSTNNGKLVTLQLLYDYKINKQYSVYNDVCQIDNIAGIDQGTVNCVPGSAKLVQSTYYGYGSEKFEVNMYSYILNGEQHLDVRTKNSCIPISGQNRVQNGFNDWAYSGWTEGIKDVSVFDVPTACRHVSPKMNPSTTRTTIRVDPNNII